MTSRYWQVPYNHWSWAERCAIIPIQQAAIRRGVIERPTTCCICGRHEPVQRDGRWQIVLHTERYNMPLEIYPSCRTCHGALHGRFTDPARWQRILQRHGQPGSWILALSLDPASQHQPFEVTYPHGIPPSPWDGRPQLDLPLSSI